MVIPNLDNVKALKCVKSNATWWTKGKKYPVCKGVNGDCIVCNEGDEFHENNTICMDFEIIYKDEAQEEFNPNVGDAFVFIDCEKYTFVINEVLGDQVKGVLNVGGNYTYMDSYSMKYLSTHFRAIENKTPQQPTDQVKNPKHYEFFGENSIPLIVRNLTVEEWLGACKFNSLKYKLRIGKKDDLEKEVKKSLNFETIFDQHKHLCRGA